MIESNFAFGKVVNYIENLGTHLVIHFQDGEYTTFEAKQYNNYAYLEECQSLPPEIQEKLENNQEEFNWETV